MSGRDEGMSLGTIPVDQISAADLQRLVDDGVIESRELDYKEQLPGGSDHDKKEFLADVSAFANTIGGDLVVGVREDRDQAGRPTGVPDALVGVSTPNWDAERIRLENLVRDGLDPRMMGLRVERVDLPGAKRAVVIRVPRSVLAPHMVTFKHWSRFYRRSSGGKYPMDVVEIRQAFLLGGELSERADLYRRERVDRVLSSESPLRVSGGAKVFLHVVPLAYEPWSLDLSDTHTREVVSELGPIACGTWDTRLNFDGALNFKPSQQPGLVDSYAQVFRTGAVEMCNARLLRPRPQTGNVIDPRRVVSSVLENEVRLASAKALNVVATLGVPLPYLLFITLTGVEGYVLYLTPTRPPQFPARAPIDRDTLYIPGRIFDAPGGSVDPILKPAFDAIWNAAGYPASENFSEDGRWTAPPGP
jgi:hypothetical protein